MEEATCVEGVDARGSQKKMFLLKRESEKPVRSTREISR